MCGLGGPSELGWGDVRYLRFKDVAHVRREQAYLIDLIDQSIQAELAGKKLPPLPDEIEFVPELQARMSADDAFRCAFEALTKRPSAAIQHSLREGQEGSHSGVSDRERIPAHTGRKGFDGLYLRSNQTKAAM